jgi:hypothetical protein
MYKKKTKMQTKYKKKKQNKTKRLFKINKVKYCGSKFMDFYSVIA